MGTAGTGAGVPPPDPRGFVGCLLPALSAFEQLVSVLRDHIHTRELSHQPRSAKTSRKPYLILSETYTPKPDPRKGGEEQLKTGPHLATALWWTHPPVQSSPAFSHSHLLVLGPIGWSLEQPRPMWNQAGSDAGGGSCLGACPSLTGHFRTGCMSTLSLTQQPRQEEAKTAQRRSPACPTGCNGTSGICTPTAAERGWKCSTILPQVGSKSRG